MKTKIKHTMPMFIVLALLVAIPVLPGQAKVLVPHLGGSRHFTLFGVIEGDPAMVYAVDVFLAPC